MINDDLRTELINVLGVGWDAVGKICEGFVNAEAVPPFIWYQRQSGTEELLLNAVSDLSTTVFAVEVISNVLADVQTIANEIRVNLHNYSGAFGASHAWLVEVTDQQDDYTPQGQNDENAARFTSALTISIMHVTDV